MYEIYTVYDEVPVAECKEIHPRMIYPQSRDSCMELCLDIPGCRGVKIMDSTCYFYGCDCTVWKPFVTMDLNMIFMYRYCIPSGGKLNVKITMCVSHLSYIQRSYFEWLLCYISLNIARMRVSDFTVACTFFNYFC